MKRLLTSVSKQEINLLWPYFVLLHIYLMKFPVPILLPNCTCDNLREPWKPMETQGLNPGEPTGLPTGLTGLPTGLGLNPRA